MLLDEVPNAPELGGPSLFQCLASDQSRNTLWRGFVRRFRYVACFQKTCPKQQSKEAPECLSSWGSSWGRRHQPAAAAVASTAQAAAFFHQSTHSSRWIQIDNLMSVLLLGRFILQVLANSESFEAIRIAPVSQQQQQKNGASNSTLSLASETVPLLTPFATDNIFSHLLPYILQHICTLAAGWGARTETGEHLSLEK